MTIQDPAIEAVVVGSAPLEVRAHVGEVETDDLLANAAENLTDQCVVGIRATERGPDLVEKGLMLATALALSLAPTAANAGTDAINSINRRIDEAVNVLKDVAQRAA